MRKTAGTIFLSCLLAAQLAAAQATENPAKEKFQQDLKAAVLNQGITIPQLKELQAQAQILKAYKAQQTPGAPVDLLTPWSAVSKMKAIMAQVKEPDRTSLEQDMEGMMAN